MKTKTFILLTGLFFPILINAQLPEKAEDISPLLNGETVPNAMLTSPDGKKFQLKEIVGQKPTVLLFYRGGWCPFCNAHLLEIQGVQNQVVNLGYQIIAISPDSPQNLIATDEKQDLAYSLYSDAEGKLIKAMGLAFKAPERYSGMLLEKSGGLNPGFLPVPAVFVLDTSGKILFEYINPDYKTRLKADMLMAVLKSIQNK
ncbi:peroxiredoxin-like family protein [Thermophagus xiamenensis]|uniref:thioredoxin-dependent peroxiredoxin n=1 Tax=Thermophagus xiamenensis TaxID=385682 RepID=A0A1I1WFK8_9BACT|nr:peroxiredoxin-like family protein [Thermophagus xiamenensis]SFD93927.1 Peroxiredoxin [Thermophagus xiamenensis]